MTQEQIATGKAVPENKAVIIGGGPAGLSAAINIAYEGIEAVLVDNKPGLGGQAKESTLIRNYPGFPHGVSGKDLINNFVQQADSLGVRIINAEVVNMFQDGFNHILETDQSDEIVAPAVIVAAGLQYNRLNAKGAARFNGYGVSYTRPMAMEPQPGQCFVVVGGGNSAGQAAQFLSRIAGCNVKLVVRGSDLDTMSAALLNDLKQAANIDTMFNAEITEVLGNEHIKSVVIKQNDSLQTVATNGLFVFIGGRPKTYWLKDSDVMLNDKGYIVPARLARDKWTLKREPYPFETTAPGVFALGDVRVDSGRRIATAVGEGSAIAPVIYAYLQSLRNSNGID